MITLRQVVPALCLVTSLSGVAVYAATTTAPGSDCAGHHWHHGYGGGLGATGFVLHKLDLTADQKTQIKAILAGEKSQFEALRKSTKANLEALATTPPTDPGYAALIQTAQTDAATRIKLKSEIWTQIHENVLTKAQQEKIPAIIAAAQAARQEKIAAWKAQHSETPHAETP